MKDIDSKTTVLIALYAEYQKDLPKMDSITNTSIDMDIDVFNASLDKLQTEGYITGVEFFRADGNPYYSVSVDNLSITRDGVQKVEDLMGLKKEKSAAAKLKKLIELCGRLGLQALKWYIASKIEHINDIC